MTNITPQQMRELADEFAMEVAAVRAHNESLGLKLNGGYVSVSLDKMAEHSAALRTAADQLDAVRTAVDEVGDMLDGRGRYLSEVLREILGMER